MFDHVIKDPDWRAALHGRPVMRTEYAGEVFFICPAKAIHPASGQASGRCDNPYNLALMIKHRRENAAGQCHRKNKAPGDSKNRGPFS